MLAEESQCQKEYLLFSHPLDDRYGERERVLKYLGLADIDVETWAKNCSKPSLKGKEFEVTLQEHNLKFNLQKHHFVYFYEDKFNQILSKFYYLLEFPPYT